ncbi:MAG: GNAT family N-acetyltransferase [Defluviitaleaceae bacterium]|nr:GNAT family N-acetyltransferase [Defluviitaleaceae bacterium]
MEYSIVRVNKDNYSMFDDMVFYRGNGRYKNKEESNEDHDFTSCYTALEIQTFYVFAAKSENHFVGYVFINYLPKVGSTNGRGWLFIDDLWVNPDFRRKGIANALMKKADNLSKEMNTVGLRLYVNAENPEGIFLYKKCGYAQTFGGSMLMQKAWQ